jgi:predicted aspartyl protease
MYYPKKLTGKLSALILFVLLQSIFLSNSYAAENGSIFSLRTGQESTQIPFRFINNMIVIPVQVGGERTLNFILDTGTTSPLILNEKCLKGLPYQKGRKIGFTGAGMGKSVRGNMTTGISMGIGDAIAPQIGMLVLHRNPLDRFYLENTRIHGIMGATIFRSFIVEIDYLTQTLILHKNDKWISRQDYEQLPLELSYSKPLINTSIREDGREEPLRLMLDTGFNGKLLMYPEAKERLSLKPGLLASKQGRGYNGKLDLPLAEVEGLQIGEHIFYEVETLLPDADEYRSRANNASGRDGILGNKLLKNFSIALDYPGRRLFIRKGGLPGREEIWVRESKE